MDQENTVRDYLRPSGAARVLFWLLLAITVVLALFSAKSFLSADTAEAEPFHPVYAAEGDYVYLDIVAVSDWLYDYDGSRFYVAQDGDGYFYIVVLPGSDLDKLGAQMDYWYQESPDAPQPAGYTLFGTASAISEEKQRDLADMLGVDVAEFPEYFGTLYLDATTSPAENSGYMYLVFALFAFLLWVLSAVSYLTAQKRCKLSLQRLSDSGQLLRAASELEAPTNEDVGKGLRLTKSFIFCKNSGLAVPYSDVKWVFKRVQRVNFIPVSSFLVMNTLYVRNIPLAKVKVKDKGNVGQHIVDRILENNSGVMVGYTQENIKAFNAMFREAKQR